MISRWKAEFVANMGAIFEGSGKADEPDIDTQELYAQIGQLKEENEFLKKVSGDSGDSRKSRSYKSASKKHVNAQAMRVAKR